MDPETLTALAESLEQHAGALDPDLGPYLDAACEVMDRAGGREVAVGFLGTVKGWRFTGAPPRYDPPIEASDELSVLIQIMAGICMTDSPRGSSVSWAGQGEFVIDAQRTPRATFHELDRWSSGYLLANASDVLRELKRSGIHAVTCTFEYDDGLRFTSLPQPLPEWVELAPPLREMIRGEIQETLNQAAWPRGASGLGRYVRIRYWEGIARVDFRAFVRGEALAKVD